MATLKKDAPPHVVEALRQIEAQADECWRPLQILECASNIATWALLTGGIRIVENEQTIRGSNTTHFVACSSSRTANGWATCRASRAITVST